ncbi:MAG TPA: hypothetical protein VMU82_02040 [Acetobacteraceae bacterium]|nr:hypothetical protein [Acetobacteraceae bacterium]
MTPRRRAACPPVRLVLAGALLPLLGACAASGPGVAGPRAAVAPPDRRADLVGLTATALQAALGPPALRRTDGPAEVWLYRAPSCSLNVVLYRQPAGAARVAEADAVALTQAPTRASTCLHAIAGQAVPLHAMPSRAAIASPAPAS